MNQKCIKHAKKEQFETATKLRDNLYAVNQLLDKQPIVSKSTKTNKDVFSYYSSEKGIMLASIHVRMGRKVGIRSFFLSHLDSYTELQDEPKAWFTSFLNQYYLENIIPDEILISVNLSVDLIKLLQDALKERSNKKVNIIFPTDVDGSKLIQVCCTLAHDKYKEYVSRSDKKKDALLDIQKKFKLKVIPKKIECYDISTFQGSETVASQVTFINGVPEKEFYRRYKIKSISNIDDYKAIKEVLTRRFLNNNDEQPDLVLVDGGKGQLNIAILVLKELKIEIPVVGIAKSRTKGNFTNTDLHTTEERFFFTKQEKIQLCLKLILKVLKYL